MDSPDTALATTVLGEAFGCSPATAEALAERSRMRSHPAHSVIIAGETTGTHVHVMVDGHARMAAVAVDGRLVVIEDYLRGDFLGEAALFERRPAGHPVSAVVASQSAAFAHDTFLDLMDRHSAVALAVSRRLIARLARVSGRMVEVATLSATGRIHAELLRQARASADLAIRPAPVLAQLALSVQSTRETVSRTISALEKRGIITRNDHELRVVAPHRLEELIY